MADKKLGGIIAAIGGIITILATFLFSWINGSYVYGIAGIMRISGLLGADGDYLAYNLNAPIWIKYIVLVLMILFLLSGILQLFGFKVRALAIIGAVLPLFVAIVIFLTSFGLNFVISNFVMDILLGTFTDAAPLVVNIVPISYGISNQIEGIGVYLMIIGSIMAVVSGFMERED